jgi:hypothetical protein
MKHYLLTPEGLKQIADADLLRWRAQGSFMNAEGPTTIPSRMTPGDVEALGGLLGKAENFVYWMAPDFRVIFATKDGAIDNGGKWWKIRFEWRGVDKNGKAGVSAARFERKITAEEVLPAIESTITNMVKAFAQQPGADPTLLAAAKAAEAQAAASTAPTPSREPS